MKRRQFINGLTAGVALTTAAMIRPARANTNETQIGNVVTPEQFGAKADYIQSTDTGTDNTPYFTQAINYLASIGGGILKLGAGNYLGRFNIETPYIKIEGEGEWLTSLYNVDNNPAIIISNQANPITDISITDMAICNRNPSAWPSSDGIAIQGNQVNQSCDFLTFKNLYIFEMQNGISIEGRTIWNLYERVHISTARLNGINVNGTDNCGAQSFVMCRIGACGQHGIFVNSRNTSNPIFNWSFYNTTIEHNLENGIRITGIGGGIQSWLFSACYMEENTYGISPGGQNGLVKASIFIDCRNIFGLTLDTCTLFGSAAPNPDLDYGVFVNTSLTMTAYGEIKNTRFGTSTINDIYWPEGILLGANGYTYGVTNNISRSQGSLDIRDITRSGSNFVPSLNFGGVNSGITYSNQVGRYAIHGNIVYFEIYVSLTNKGYSLGPATIEGLPFATSNTSGLIPTFAVHADQFVNSVTHIMARSFPESTTIQLNKFASGTATTLTDADFGNYSALSITGHYLLS